MVAPDTNVDRNGKTPSGHSGEALVINIFHAKPTYVDVNCILGALEVIPFIGDIVYMLITGYELLRIGNDSRFVNIDERYNGVLKDNSQCLINLRKDINK